MKNPSFEDTLVHSGCITQIETAINWFNPSASTPDLFTYKPSCVGSSINNPVGFQLPRTGTSYAGIYGHLIPTRDYIAIRLDSTLVSGCNYYLEFYISLANTSGLACDKIGAAFTNDTTGFSLISAALPLIPVVTSPPGVLMQDTLNWMKVSGNFIASGIEDYLVIGNFYNTSNTFWDTVNVNGFLNSAYYYIDDILILPCNVNSIFDENQNSDLIINFFTNPISDKLILEFSAINAFQFLVEIFDLTGQLIWRNNTNLNPGKNVIYLNHIENGMYILCISESQKKYSYKLTVLK